MKKKTLKILYWAITILFVGFMLFGALSELMQVTSAQELLKHLGYPTYVNYILGLAKVIGAIILIQWGYSTIKEWAYAGFTIDIVGATVSNYFVDGIMAAAFTLIFLIPLFLSYWLWKKAEEAA